MKGRFWLANELALVKELWGTMPASDIAKRLDNRSPTAIVQAANRYGLTNPYHAHLDIDLKQVCLLVAQGKACSDIADLMGCSKRTINQHMLSAPQWARDKSARNGRRKTGRMAGEANRERVRKSKVLLEQSL